MSLKGSVLGHYPLKIGRGHLSGEFLIAMVGELFRKPDASLILG